MQNLQKSEETAAQDNNQLILTEHFNLPQLLAILLNMAFMVAEWARGTGKSTGAIAWRTIHNAKVMPQSAGTFCAPSYRKFIEHMWPGIRKGYQDKFKLKEGIDYLFLKPPLNKWKRPYMAPGSYYHFVSFPNGSGYHIISQDHGQTSNALDTDWMVGDEMKLQNGEKIQEEVFNTMRGNRDKFGHLAEHYSRWLFSDKYTRADSKQTRWISEYKSQAISGDIIKKILQTIVALRNSKSNALIKYLEQELVALRRNGVFYSEASAVDNLAVLGLEFIKNQEKSSTPYGLLTSIFNENVEMVEGEMFYPLFSHYVHGYEASDNNRIISLIEQNGYDGYMDGRDSRLDTDVIKTKPIKLCMDFGASYNWMVAVQLQGNVLKALKNFWVEKPKKSPDLVPVFCNYYQHHESKTVEVYYDVSANKENSRTNELEAQEIIRLLRAKGWKVINKMGDSKSYISHYNKFKFWSNVLDNSKQRDDRFPKFQYHRTNCHELSWSMSHAKLVKSTNEEKKYHKDKKSETDDKIPQWQATHLSDCVDWLAKDYLPLLTDKANKSFINLGRN